MRPVLATSEEGVRYRDLNGNGRMDPYEDPRLDVGARVEDLLARLSLEEKVGLMFQTVIEAGADGSVLEEPGAISKSPTSVVVLEKHLSHFNVHVLADARSAAVWHNAVQAIAERTPHGIPVTISTDPRHAFIENAGVVVRRGVVLAVARAARPGRAPRPRRGARVRRHRPAGVRRGGHPGGAAPDAGPRHRTPVGPPGRHLRPGPGPRHRARDRLPRRVPGARPWGRRASPAPPSTSPGAAPRRTGRTPTSPTGASRSTPVGGSPTT